MAIRDTTSEEFVILTWIHDKRDAKGINLETINDELVNHFQLTKQEATDIFEVWINNFNDAGNYKDIVI